MTAVSPSRSGVSPSSSPRLPSPPPIPEVQFGPQSPGADLSKELSLDVTSKPDEGAARRIRPGTKAAEMALGPPLVPLSQLDSPFQLQEHLKSLYSLLTHTSESTHTIPITKESGLQLATPPKINDTESVDKNLWLYELCRFLTQKANIVSIFLMNDHPPCSSQTCPEMRASEWQYLCAVHEPPKSCCAIDYCNHTLDWAANVLTSPKHFPSRLALGGEGGNAIQSMRQLTNIFRRVYRIFAHAWFQHRDVFWSVEATYGLYIFFKVVCDEYHLIPEDSYTIPPEAEGGRDASDELSRAADTPHPQILRKNDGPSSSSDDTPDSTLSESSEAAASTTISTGATTRRHKHTPSTGSHVATIAEGQEDDEEPSSAIIAPSSAPESLPIYTAPTEKDTSLSQKQNPPADRHLPKLDIRSTVPKYEPRAPEDPTPTGNVDDHDPMSVNPPAYTSHDTANPMSLAEIETPTSQTRAAWSEEEEKVTSPSGGSIRTGGIDVLQAILGHINDGEDEDRGNVGGRGGDEQDEQMSPIKTKVEQDVKSGPQSEPGGQVDGSSGDAGNDTEPQVQGRGDQGIQVEVEISVEETAEDDDEDRAQATESAEAAA